jgi:hypothetical protein
MPTPEHVSGVIASRTDEDWVFLVTFEHDDLPSPIRLTNYAENLVSNGDTYLRFPMTFRIPDELEAGTGQGQLVTTNVDRTITLALRQLDDTVLVTVQTVMVSDPDVDQHPVPQMTVLDWECDTFSITLNLGFPDDDDAPASSRRFTPDRAPGLW